MTHVVQRKFKQQSSDIMGLLLFEKLVSSETEAYRDYKARVENAWRESPDLGTILNFHMCGARIALAAFIQTIRFPPRRGRRRLVPSNLPPVVKAERNAALQVAFAKANWLRENPHRKRVPSAETEKLISTAISDAEGATGVPSSKISEANIRNLIKSGRIQAYKFGWNDVP
jgi:hypothetical protein